MKNMESIDTNVLRTLRDWRDAGERALLATVVRTWGSSPRPVGAIFALRQDSRCVGSVSGGCIEDDLVARYSGAGMPGPSAPPELMRYGVSAEEAFRFGLPCGGTLELLLEFDPAHAQLDQQVRHLEAGALVRRTVSCHDGKVALTLAERRMRCRSTAPNCVPPSGPTTACC